MIRSIVDRVMGEDAFIAFADGSADELAKLTEFSNIYNRISYRMMFMSMRGGMMGNMQGQSFDKIIKEALEVEDGRLMQILEELQLPPVIAGCRVTDAPGDILAQLDGLAQDGTAFRSDLYFRCRGSWILQVVEDQGEGCIQ